MGKHAPPRWTEDQLQQWLSRRGAPTETTAPPGPPKPKRRASAAKTQSEPGSGKKRAPRRGIEVQPIVDALKKTAPRIELDRENGILSIMFEGVRLLSLNEVISILPFRPYEVFRYKKAWRAAMGRALVQLGVVDWREVFPGPVSITFFRRSPRAYDLDSPLTPFKYALDALVKHKYYIAGTKKKGVIIDDSRQYVPKMKEAFEKGPAGVGMRLERCQEVPEPVLIEPYRDWFGDK